MPVKATLRDTVRNEKRMGRDLEDTPKSTGKTRGRKKGEAFSRSLLLSDPKFAAIAAVWPKLKPAIKAAIIALVRASG